jgi:hypothetical protein
MCKVFDCWLNLHWVDSLPLRFPALNVECSKCIQHF